MWTLHEVYLGSIGSRQVLGIEEGSQVYLGESTRELTLPEAATLAGMIRSPNSLSPVRHPERALERRNLVLHRMLDRGFISQEDYEHAISASLGATNDRTVASLR